MGTLRAILRRHRVWADIQQDVRLLPTLDDVGHALTTEEEAALISACLQSRSRSYPAVMLALNTGMRYSEIRLLQWKQVDFSAKVVTVGKSKTQTGTGRAIPLNARILSVLEMWAAQFPDRQPTHYVFPFEKCGGKGELDSFGFTAGMVIYGTDPTRPVGDWKEAWEKAKKRAAVILRGETEKHECAQQRRKRERSTVEPKKKSNGKDESQKAESLQCRFHDLRHSAVTRLLEAGILYPVVAKHDGMVRRYRNPYGEALRTHRKPSPSRGSGRARRSENPRGVPQKVTKVAGG